MASIILPIYPGIVLKTGSRGVDVALIQTELTGLGFSASVDGIYGAGTKQAVITYQARRGLTPDGIVGKDTWDALINEYAQRFPQNPVPYAGIVMRSGALGSCVKWFQKGQNDFRSIYTAQPQLTQDGIFGSNSTMAVRVFQRQFGLSIDGQMGKNTWNKFSEVLMAQSVSNLMKVTPTYPGSSLQQGSSGDTVRCIQSYVGQVKKAHNLNYPMPVVDGQFGSITKEAVMGFQATYGLQIDGIVGPDTWQRLASEFNLIL